FGPPHRLVAAGAGGAGAAVRPGAATARLLPVAAAAGAARRQYGPDRAELVRVHLRGRPRAGVADEPGVLHHAAGLRGAGDLLFGRAAAAGAVGRAGDGTGRRAGADRAGRRLPVDRPDAGVLLR